jgi:hypothetical protein
MDTFIDNLFHGLESAYKELLEGLPMCTPELRGLECEIDDGGNVDNMQAIEGYLNGAADVDDALETAQDILEGMVEEGIEWGDHGAHGDNDLDMDEDAHRHIRTKVVIDLDTKVTVHCSARNGMDDLRAYMRDIGFEVLEPPRKRAKREDLKHGPELGDWTDDEGCTDGE